MRGFSTKIVTVVFLLTSLSAMATVHDTSSVLVSEPNVRAINQKLKSIHPDVSFILKQEIEVKGGKLISKKVLLNGVRVEEVKLNKIDPTSIRIDKFLGNSYYFITIFSKDKKASIDYGYEEMRTSKEETQVDDISINALKNNGNIDHFCLSLPTKADAEEVVKMIITLINGQ